MQRPCGRAGGGGEGRGPRLRRHRRAGSGQPGGPASHYATTGGLTHPAAQAASGFRAAWPDQPPNPTPTSRPQPHLEEVHAGGHELAPALVLQRALGVLALAAQPARADGTLDRVMLVGAALASPRALAGAAVERAVHNPPAAAAARAPAAAARVRRGSGGSCCGCRWVAVELPRLLEAAHGPQRRRRPARRLGRGGRVALLVALLLRLLLRLLVGLHRGAALPLQAA